jgi:hypothetical protein
VFIQRHKILRKITAFLLIGLLLLIHTVKFFHSHLPLSIKITATETEPGKKLSSPCESRSIYNCAICDYQLAKDCDIEENIFSSGLSLSEILLIIELPGSISDNFHSSDTERGPPSSSLLFF